MTSPATDRPRRRPRLTPARWIILAGVSNLVSTGIFVYAATEASNTAGKVARQENCTNVIEAFDAYTQALADVSGADPDTVRDFRDAYEPQLEECH